MNTIHEAAFLLGIAAIGTLLWSLSARRRRDYRTAARYAGFTALIDAVLAPLDGVLHDWLAMAVTALVAVLSLVTWLRR